MEKCSDSNNDSMFIYFKVEKVILSIAPLFAANDSLVSNDLNCQKSVFFFMRLLFATKN
jgi:hypothetical protein